MNIRKGDGSYQPYNIEDLNTFMKNKSVTNACFFAEYKNKDQVYICLNTKKVYRISTKGEEPVTCWSSFSEWLEKESMSIRNTVDKTGITSNPLKSTLQQQQQYLNYLK